MIDRAWRAHPEDAEALAPIYGRLLSLEDREHDAALRLLQRVTAPDADVAAFTVRAYLRLRRADDAQRHLDLALREYCLAPDSLLAQEASEALQNPGAQIAGWVGLGPTLEFHGELAAGSVDSLQIRLGDTALAYPVKTMHRDGRAAFSFRVPQAADNTILHLSSDGVPLLGSGRRLPLEFALDGRAESDGKRVSGWARIGWLPTQPVQLSFEDEDGHAHRSRTKAIARPGLRWPFQTDLRGAGLRGSRIRITAQLPDGRWQPLPDTPLLLDRALRFRGAKPVRLPRWYKESSPARRAELASSKCTTPIDVLIPIHGGGQETLACLDSVLATVAERGRVVVVDDATEDAALTAALDDLATAGRITLLRNERNLGFVGSVNRALAMQSTHDIVLLNSDTRVFGDWLQRMAAAAYGAPRIGTITPLSNNGSIASYPRESAISVDPEQAAALDKLAATTHRGISVEIPVGVGFCLYVRRDCLNDVGELDASVFGMGYGEEVDFCMRARQRGWSHRIAADVYVYHAGAGSFGARRAALLDRSHRLLNLRYPGYDRFIADFLTQDPLHPLRRRLDERRLSSFDGRFVLLVTLALEGGVERFVAERSRQIREQGLFPLLLKARKAGDSRRCELSTEAIDAPNLQFEIPAELSELTSTLRCLPIEAIEIQHFLDLDARVIETVRALEVPYDVVIHDYSWICPRVTLIDGSGRYCHEPAVSACRSCVRKNGSRLGETLSVPALRARSAAWLGAARRVLAPSADTASRLKNYFPSLEIEVRPHAPPRTPPPQIAPPTGAKTVRVGLIGAIGGHKGYQVLLACARDAAARRLPLEFVVIGYTENDKPLLKTGKVFITGRYSETEVPHLLRRERPDMVFLPSVWPETWCYTLDYALATGLPVVSFDLGAIAERLRTAGLGILLPLDLNSRQINDRLLGRAADLGNSALYVQTSWVRKPDDAKMHESEGNKMMKPPVDESAQEQGLSASVQLLPLPAGLYLFSVKAAAAPSEGTEGQLRVPAMHVSLGPGVHSEQVEFIAGPGTEGTWLFAQGDVLVAKVNGAGATLILNSVRSSIGEVLSITVERLEGRAQAAVSAPAESADMPIQLPVAATSETNASALAEPKSESDVVHGAELAVPVEIKTHIRSRGDMNFADVPWAGRVAPGLWIESFSVQPLKHLAAHDIEYKGLTGTGFETPWLSDDQICGTKGMSVPLVGFAMRLKPGPQTSSYDCEYCGYYRSGVVVGPLRNGAPCRSTVANDPLEGIQIRIVKRPKAVAEAAKFAPSGPSIKAPTFGRYRDAEPAPLNGAAKELRSATTAVKPAKRADAPGKSDRGTRSIQRS